MQSLKEKFFWKSWKSFWKFYSLEYIILSENRFSEKTYLYTIASRVRGSVPQRGRLEQRGARHQALLRRQAGRRQGQRGPLRRRLRLSAAGAGDAPPIGQVVLVNGQIRVMTQVRTWQTGIFLER